MKRSRGTRIISGLLAGRRLPVPPQGVRPTQARVREALFNRWQTRVDGCRFLDLFAGSGAVGVEASSRGADWVTWIEADRRALSGLAALATLVPAGDVRRGRLPKLLSVSPVQPYDLAFADPPYAFASFPALLEGVQAWLTCDAELAVEHDARRELPQRCGDLEQVDCRTYGGSRLAFFRLTGSSDSPSSLVD